MIFVGASLRTQVYAHAALLGTRRPSSIIHFMVEQDSAQRLAARLVLRRAVVVMGGSAAERYRQAVPKVPVRAVNNFLLPEEFDSAKATPDRVADGEPPTVGVLARLIPEKGVLELVQELAAVPAGWSRLLVGGPRQDERYTAVVEQRIAALGLQSRVNLLGPVDDLGAFFEHADVLIVPSTGREGQPTVIVEALAHGRPVLVRAPLWSREFQGFPVHPYRSAAELGSLLAGVDGEATVDRTRVAAAFGIAQVVEAFERAARVRLPT